MDFYTATKHYGVWYLKVVRELPDAAIAAQAGWAERSVTKMVETYSHAVASAAWTRSTRGSSVMQIVTQSPPNPLPERT